MAKRRYKLTGVQRRIRYAGRKALGAVLLAAIVTGLVLADRLGVFGTAPTPDRERYDGKTFLVVKVVDGDTLDIDARDEQRDRPHTRIRLWGVDTPELAKKNRPAQHFADRARQFAEQMAAGKQVRLELDYGRSRGRYVRLLAYVYLPDGRMLNRSLVEEGYGYADPRFAHRRMSEFNRLQRQAMKARRGLWKEIRPSGLPAYYRDLKLPAD